MGTVDSAPDAPVVAGGVDRRRALAGAVVVVLVAAAATWTIYRQRHDFVAGVRTLGFRPLLVSLPAALIAVYATFLSWREVLAGLQVRLSLRAGGRVFFISQLGKYLPGSVWPIALQMQAGVAQGARRRTMLAGNLLTLALSCTVGLILGGVTLPISQPKILGQYWWVAFALLALLPLLHPRAVPKILDLLFSLVGRESLGERLEPRSAVRAVGWSLLSWVAFGLHLALLCAAFGSLSARDLAACLAAICLAVTLGVLFIPAPAGAGIRDVVLGLVLASVLTGSGQVLAVVVASRIVLIATDVLLAAIATLMPTHSQTHTPERRS